MKKRDVVVVADDVDDEVRTSVSQNWVTATLHIEEFFLRIKYIALSLFRMDKNVVVVVQFFIEFSVHV